MKIAVLGMDPSLRNWGLAEAMLDLTTGELSTPVLSTIKPKDLKGKQVRSNSNDLHLAEELARGAIPAAKLAKAIFIECPVGSQSARAMASFGICVGVLGSIRALGIPLIEVTAMEVKVAMTGNKTASKLEVINAAVGFYPDANFPMDGKKVASTAEHVCDAIGAIHAGVHTPMFQNLMRLLKES